MLYNYDFEIASIVLTAAIMLMYFLRHAYRTRCNLIFLGMLILNLVSSVADIGTAYTISYPLGYPVWMDFASNITYLASHNLTAIAFFAYVCTLVKGDQNLKIERTIWRATGAVEIILIVTTPLTGLIFYLDDGLHYCHGPLFFILYALATIMIIYSVVLMLIYRRKLSNYQAIAMLYYIGAVIVAILLHLVLPYVMVEDFAAAMALSLLYLSLENPEFYMYKNTYCYNSRALSATVGELINSKHPFAFVSFSFSEADSFTKTVGSNVVVNVTERIIQMLHEEFPKNRVYCLGSMQFGVLIPADRAERDDKQELKIHSLEVTEIIEAKLRSASNGTLPFFHLVFFPDFIEDVDDFESTVTFGLANSGATGSNRVTIANRSSLDLQQRKLAVLSALRKALDNKTLSLNYQPIKQVSTGKYVSAEVLCRMVDEDLGFVSPDEFITLAEQNGLASAISDYVLEEACRFWKENDLPSLGVEYLEINLSALDFMRENFAKTLLRMLAKYGLTPDQVNFEITETASSNADNNMFTSTMEKMVEAGMHFSVDDFGSGFASINYLIQVPADLVKVDKGILWAAMEDKNAHTVLETTMSLLKQLGKHSLCEGVETEEMAEMLAGMGCQYFQGYLYSKPLSGDEYLKFLKKHN